MLHCRSIGKTDGFGLWRTQIPSLFVVCIIFLLFNHRLSYQLMFLLYGIRMCLSRWWCLLGVCFGIDCIQRTISSDEVSLTHDSRTCVAGCDFVESSSHLFLHCNIFGSVWHLIYSWIGVSVINPFYVPDHFHQFSFSGGFGKKRRSILQVIWYATVWEIRKERNNRLFKGKESPVFQVVDRIKFISYMWLKPKYITLPFNFHGWWLSPFTMLGIG